MEVDLFASKEVLHKSQHLCLLHLFEFVLGPDVSLGHVRQRVESLSDFVELVIAALETHLSCEDQQLLLQQVVVLLLLVPLPQKLVNFAEVMSFFTVEDNRLQDVVGFADGLVHFLESFLLLLLKLLHVGVHLFEAVLRLVVAHLEALLQRFNFHFLS